MGETETTKASEDTEQKTGEEETDTSTETDGADDDTQEGADTDETTDDGSDDEEETDEDEDETDDKKSKKSTSKDDKKGEEDDEKEPPTRKRPIDFIKERQERRKAKGGEKGKDKAETDDEEDDDIDPADKETIGKVVEKALKPFVEKQMKEEDDNEVKTFLKDNPDFAKYEAKARKYMAHPSRKDVPISEIFYGVAGKDLMALGAKRAKIADQEAKKTKSGGGAADAGGVKSAADMTSAELEAKQAEVRSKMADRY